MDAFYASVEELDDPSLKGIPFAVGGSIRHGVVSTSSYEARKFGVRSGMAIFIALQLCPELKLVDHHGDRYCHFSRLVQSIFSEYDPHFVSMGLDEATLDMTDFLAKNREDPVEVAKGIQRKVFEKCRLTVSIGIACTYQLAKIGSDFNKPNGVFRVPIDREELLAFIGGLKIRKIPGIGGVTERKLQALSIETMQDVIDRRADLWFLFRQRFCSFLFASALGIDLPMRQHDKAKSISTESTFDATNNLGELMDMVEAMSMKLGKKLAKHRIACKTVTVKFKSVGFEQFSKSISFERETSKSCDVVNAALKLLMDEHRSQNLRLRLIGVKVSGLIYPDDGPRQASICGWTVKGEVPERENIEKIDKSIVELPGEKTRTLEFYFEKGEGGGDWMVMPRERKPPKGLDVYFERETKEQGELRRMREAQKTEFGTMRIEHFFHRDSV
jgi:DNA polymerase kappa